jgi:hypothetical protein
MTVEKPPGYLRPVPSGDDAIARQLEDESQGNGVTPPTRCGHPGMFISDVIADLGYASRERVEEAVNEARVAGKPPSTRSTWTANLLSDHWLCRAGFVGRRYSGVQVTRRRQAVAADIRRALRTQR